jgi:hypothetical protein
VVTSTGNEVREVVEGAEVIAVLNDNLSMMDLNTLRDQNLVARSHFNV